MAHIDLAIGVFTGESIDRLPCYVFLDFGVSAVEMKLLCAMEEEAYDRVQKALDRGQDPEHYMNLSDFHFRELEFIDKYSNERGEFMAERSQYLNEINYYKELDLKSLNLGIVLNRELILLIWQRKV
jgi:hypothetical protein